MVAALSVVGPLEPDWALVTRSLTFSQSLLADKMSRETPAPVLPWGTVARHAGFGRTSEEF